MKPLEYQSSNRIITKVMRDLKPQRTDFINDAVEWIGEAMDAIGSFAQTESKAVVTESNSHRTLIPAGTTSINKIYYTKKEIPEGETPVREDFKYELPYGSPDRHPAFVDEDPNHPVKVDRAEFDESFLISGGYIRTSFESDWILISYQAIQTDDNGFPLVPDGYEFSQALYWYIVMKMMEGGMKHPAKLGYGDAEQRWLKYCQQARNDANMPSMAEAERFKDMWVGLLPNKAFERMEDPSDQAVDADNLIVDTFQRYTVND